MMRTVAFLSTANHEKPTLEFVGKIPDESTSMVITEYEEHKVVTPAGFEEDGSPYFSEEFYQERQEKYDRLIKFNKEKARRLFWFHVEFEV